MTDKCFAHTFDADHTRIDCQRPAGHAGLHSATSTMRATWLQEPPDDRPKWRRLVDENAYRCTDPLGRVLWHLSSLSEQSGSGGGERQLQVARIVAICEQQTGAAAVPFGWDSGLDVWVLIGNFVDDGSPIPNWKGLGGFAATWLTHLTGEAP